MTENKTIKTASDLLFEMDQKLNLLLNLVQNQDLLLKTLNNKIKNLENKSVISNTSQPEKPIIKQMPGLKPGVILTENGLEQKEIVSDDEFVHVDTSQFDEEIQKSNGKKVAVQQRVIYSDGKNICLANVEITGPNLKMPKKTKTNGMGKWMTVLEPGEYVVSVTKSANKNKQNIALSSKIIISGDESSVELPQLSQ